MEDQDEQFLLLETEFIYKLILTDPEFSTNAHYLCPCQHIQCADVCVLNTHLRPTQIRDLNLMSI